MALVGPELLASVKASQGQGLSKPEQAKAAGYVRIVGKGEKAGAEIPDTHSFSNALLEAHGYTFGERRSSGRGPTGLLHVSKAGAVMVGPAYLRGLEVNPGDEFQVKVEAAEGRIVLELLEPEDSAAEGSRRQLAFA
jgi:hypothetical protein